MTRNVTVTFQNTEEARPIIEAIEADNQNATAVAMPAMVKIDCPGRLIINRVTVEEKIGRDWDLQELHLSLISLAGNVDEDDDRIIIAWGS
jgi:phenol hydroxylase P2 protein